MRAYPSLTRDFILDDLPALQGHALIAASIELDPALDAERAGLGYIGQHQQRGTK